MASLGIFWLEMWKFLRIPWAMTAMIQDSAGFFWSWTTRLGQGLESCLGVEHQRGATEKWLALLADSMAGMASQPPVFLQPPLWSTAAILRIPFGVQEMAAARRSMVRSFVVLNSKSEYTCDIYIYNIIFKNQQAEYHGNEIPLWYNHHWPLLSTINHRCYQYC